MSPIPSDDDNFLPSSDPNPHLNSELEQRLPNNNIDDSSLGESNNLRNDGETVSSSLNVSSQVGNNNLNSQQEAVSSIARHQLSSEINSNIRSNSSSFLNSEVGRTPRHQKRSDIGTTNEQRLFNMTSSDLGSQSSSRNNISRAQEPYSMASDFEMNSSSLYNNNGNNLPSSDLGSDPAEGYDYNNEDGDDQGPKSVIWGTSVDTAEVRRIFENFLMNFKYADRKDYEYSLINWPICIPVSDQFEFGL